MSGSSLRWGLAQELDMFTSEDDAAWSQFRGRAVVSGSIVKSSNSGRKTPKHFDVTTVILQSIVREIIIIPAMCFRDSGIILMKFDFFMRLRALMNI